MEELQSYITEQDTWLDSILQDIGWTREYLLEKFKSNDPMEVCPVNTAHVMPRSRLSNHLKSCRLLQLGYSKEDLKEAEEYKRVLDKNSLIHVDESTFRQVIMMARQSRGPGLSGFTPIEYPQTSDRAHKILTADERLALYKHCINTAKALGMKTTEHGDLLLDDIEQEAKKKISEKSYMELQAEIRDAKRRRQSYRAKNVHTTKKSHTEHTSVTVIRDVINTTMMSRFNVSLDGELNEPALSNIRDGVKGFDERSGDRSINGDSRRNKRSRSRSLGRKSKDQKGTRDHPSKYKRGRSSSRERQTSRYTRDRSDSRERHSSRYTRDRSDSRERQTSRYTRDRSQSGEKSRNHDENQSTGSRKKSKKKSKKHRKSKKDSKNESDDINS